MEQKPLNVNESPRIFKRKPNPKVALLFKKPNSEKNKVNSQF